MILGKVIKNSTYLFLSELIATLVNFLVTLRLINHLGTNDYGIWSSVQALPVMLLILSDMGLNSLMLRIIARDVTQKEEIVGKFILIKIFMSLMFVFTLALLVLLIGYERHICSYMVVVSLALCFSALYEMLMTVYRAQEDFKYDAKMNIIGKVMNTVFILIVIESGLRIGGLVVALVLVNIIMLMLILKKYVADNSIKLVAMSVKECVVIVRQALPFAIISFILPVFLQIDIIMLSRLKTYESVAIYNAPYRIILFLYIVPYVLRKAMFPSLSNFSTHDGSAFQNSFNYACKLVILTGVPMAVGIYLLADKIIPFLFSDTFSQSVVPLKIMAIMMAMNYVNSIFNVTMCSSGKEHAATVLFIFATIFNAFLDFLLIPRYDFIGACIASLAAEGLLIFGGYYIIRNTICELQLDGEYVKIVLATVVMGTVVVVTMKMLLLIQIVIGILVYLMSLFFMGVITHGQINNIRKLFLEKA
ncbi:flippase [Geomobilimonas luticola]|uniref:Flippase n=1 Tax=Geomobilimonas luticola TaxID=1114878 RepID=A0ABS5SEJ6_9BACT|nr:flippase [Geomobilimonas luticola]MBT0652934.1 flippase [Geomobilimonas luticola]